MSRYKWTLGFIHAVPITVCFPSLGILRLSIIAAVNHRFTDSFPLKGPKSLLGVLYLRKHWSKLEAFGRLEKILDLE